ncbi:hypothetical protein EYZ11_011055 [Aspergillus tanneri]|uniref:Zinc finger, CCHC domain containing n=1 Tax=Aspergillus tanneri TaxID=1220188 RepID=A0A4S3J3U2_9EURO|nr:Zinc finger, CCHC domain containing [Aspergillus tanneri]KAA8649858.1 Zinc finger, CCHC domain containing [Aspergillus tanneri]THC89490.1 hypothetical protein EYZ11_011055 [Aspergillus tanneri]
MSNSSDGDHDSRTASVGAQRIRGNGSSTSSRQSPMDPPNSKRQRRNGKADNRDVHDFVPRGASFSANSLEVDPDSTSSSGFDSDSNSDFSDETSSSGEEDSGPQEGNPGGASTVRWNRGSKSVIRTSLSSRGNKPDGNAKQSSQFDAVNNKYWRSRSASASASDDSPKPHNNRPDHTAPEEGELQEDTTVASNQMHLSDDSDDSDSLVSEADDSILLNIGTRDQDQGNFGQKRKRSSPAEDGDDYDPETLPMSEVLSSGKASDLQNRTAHGSSKEEAFRRFSEKYPATPSTLADLDRSDMESQARCLFYDRDINDIDLQLPIACTECLREGHLAEVCPSKECVHCGAWNQHQSSFCPKWRRCQRCRDRGHDEPQCSSALKSSASEIPCDLCGSSAHLERQCDLMWKIPRQDPPMGPVLVSLSCSHCTSNRHLVGDCPSLPRPIPSSSWTLRGIDPSMVTNINSVIGSRRGGAPSRGGQRGMRIKGRANQRSPSPDSDDMMSRPRQLLGRNTQRPNIRIGGGIGKNHSLAPADTRAPVNDARQIYRDRQDCQRGNGRQRSWSPNPPPGRNRKPDSRQPAPRSPPPNRSKPPPRRGGADRGGRGGPRGGGKRGGGDTYRPLPSAAKEAWDRYRL